MLGRDLGPWRGQHDIDAAEIVLAQVLDLEGVVLRRRRPRYRSIARRPARRRRRPETRVRTASSAARARPRPSRQRWRLCNPWDCPWRWFANRLDFSPMRYAAARKNSRIASHGRAEAGGAKPNLRRVLAALPAGAQQGPNPGAALHRDWSGAGPVGRQGSLSAPGGCCWPRHWPATDSPGSPTSQSSATAQPPSPIPGGR